MEPQRLQEVIHDLEAGTSVLPRGVTHHPDVLRRYFYERIFQGKWDGEIMGPEGQNMTKHNGKFISLKALRQRILGDIEDLIAFMIMPAGEELRAAVYPRTPEGQATLANKEDWEPFVPHYLPAINQKGYRYAVREEQAPLPRTPEARNDGSPEARPSRNISSRSQYETPQSLWKPFREQLAEIENRQPSAEKPNAGENLAGNDMERKVSSEQVFSDNQSERLKEVSSKHENAQDPSYSPQHDALPRPTIGQQPHLPQIAGHILNPKAMDFDTLSKILRQPMSDEERQNILDTYFPKASQHATQAFHDQIPNRRSHHPSSGVSQDDLYSSSQTTNQDQLPSSSHGHMGYGTQQATSNAYFQRPHTYSPQPLNLGNPQQTSYPPFSQGPPPPSAGQFLPYDHPELDSYPPFSEGPPPPRMMFNNGPSLWGTTAPRQGMTAGTGATHLPFKSSFAAAAFRPAAQNRVAAQIYRNDPTFHHGGLAQVRGTPGPFVPQAQNAPLGSAPSQLAAQQHQDWLYHMGRVQATNSNVSALPYRPGSDDMRPHAVPGVPSVAYQNLTRNTVPTLAEAKAPESKPFVETAKEKKPPGWGVLKIGNVSFQVDGGRPLALGGNKVDQGSS